jgi:hypothetical protein
MRPLFLLLGAAAWARDPHATEWSELTSLFRCGPATLRDPLAAPTTPVYLCKRHRAVGSRRSPCVEYASLRDACLRRCARTRGCDAMTYNGSCALYRTGANGTTPHACVAQFRERERPLSGEVLHRFAAGLAYRFFSVVDLKHTVHLLARDGLWPNAAPDERLLVWATDASLQLRGRPAEVHLPLPKGVDERPAHNFAALVDDENRVHGFGGRARGGTVLPETWNRSGIHYFPPSTAMTFGEGRVRVTGLHAGCQELRRTPVTCEWDGKLSAALFGKGAALFGRLNTAHGRRWVQVAVSDMIDGDFSSFEPIRIKGWGGCRVRRASIYYAVIERNPVDANTLLGLFPMHEGRRCYLALAFSCDAVHWSAPTWLVDLGCSNEAGRVRDYPADGLVVRGSRIYYYVHRDMPTSNLVVNRDLPRDGSALVRHTLDAAWLRNTTRAALDDLGGTCAAQDVRAPFWGAVFDGRGIHQDRLAPCTPEDRAALAEAGEERQSVSL